MLLSLLVFFLASRAEAAPKTKHSKAGKTTTVAARHHQRSPEPDSWKTKVLRLLGNGGIFVESENGQPLFSHRPDEGFVPASTMKVVTSLCALRHLGPNYRFRTEFYLLPEQILGIKGYGDPSLISEAFEPLSAGLAEALGGNRSFRGIQVDSSFFVEGLNLDGYGDSSNPYDALPTALAANFNTLNLERNSRGEIISAEAATPLTQLARAYGKRLAGPGKQRFNLGSEATVPERYFAELLSLALGRHDVRVGPGFLSGKIPHRARPIYVHQSANTLLEMLPPMLEFSTNFTANEIFLQLGAKRFGEPATVEKSQNAMTACLQEVLPQERIGIGDGAGLSRRNRISPRQFVKLLREFRPYRGLLRIDKEKFQAKTGTLRGVNTYAGYFDSARYGEIRFAVLMNDDVPFQQKWLIAEELYRAFATNSPA